MSPGAEVLPASGTAQATGGDPEEPDSIVHSVVSRIRLTIEATGSLVPDVDVVLTVSGVAEEQIDSGEVVLTLPTKAMMNHVGKGLPEMPAEIRWALPPMTEGDTWSETFTVPGAPAGYYMVLVNAYTHGPDAGLYLSEGVLGTAWMFISETDGQLTEFFEDTIFPEGVPRVPGPLTTIADATTTSRPDSNWFGFHPDSVFLHVVYVLSDTQGWRPAVGTEVWSKALYRGRWSGRDTVPEDGIVALGCPRGDIQGLEGKTTTPDTKLVKGPKPLRGKAISTAYWYATASDCGKKKFVHVQARRYFPWRVLNIAAENITEHFNKTKGPVGWRLCYKQGCKPGYNFLWDRVTLNWHTTSLPDRFLWVAAHEYGHSFHHKALGGGWWIRSGVRCWNHQLDSEESHKCALQEGFANYTGTIGSDGHRQVCFEHFGTPEAGEEAICKAESNKKAKVEGYVAALFLDLIDDTEEQGDFTEYSGEYIGQVFKTCQTKSKYWFIGNWVNRSNVSNIVWCLEESIEPAYHESDSVFDGIRTPHDVKVDLEEIGGKPLDWSRIDIRTTWLKNLN